MKNYSMSVAPFISNSKLPEKKNRSLLITNTQTPKTLIKRSFQGQVTETSLLIVGGTGTLGRQIVRLALDEGYDVKCIVRPRETPADFLRDWGATVVNADLKDPSSIPAALVGSHTVIDAATARPEESIQKIDWEGKVALVQAAKVIGIKRYIFFSILDCEKYRNVPLMSIKACSEEFLKDSGLNYTIFRLSGFMQAIIGNYAVPILERRSVWGTDEKTLTAYVDTQDVARMTLSSLSRPATNRRTFKIVGPKAWSTTEVIELCETLSGGSKAKVIKVPNVILKATRNFLTYFQPALDAADRLAFTDLTQGDATSDIDMNDTYKLLGMSSTEILTLDKYLNEYYNKIIKKLKEVGAESRQTDFFV